MCYTKKEAITMLEFLNKTEPYLSDSEVTFLSENYRIAMRTNCTPILSIFSFIPTYEAELMQKRIKENNNYRSSSL